MTAKRGADHVVFDFPTGAFVCKRCCATYTLPLPAPIDVFVAAAWAFGRVHRGCPKRAGA